MQSPITEQTPRAPISLLRDIRTHPLEVIRQFALQPLSTGAVAPSSRTLATRLTGMVDLYNAQTVVELGPGTGVFTEEIQKNISRQTDFFALEVNPAFVAATKQRCPGVKVYQDEARNLPVYLRDTRQVNETDTLPEQNPDETSPTSNGRADCIISSLPWTIFNEAEQDTLLDTISASLRKGGTFISIVYLGGRLRARGRYFVDSLPLYFSEIEKTGTVWQNIPPTLIYRCKK